MGVLISPNGVRRVGRRAIEKVDHGISLTRKENPVGPHTNGRALEFS